MGVARKAARGRGRRMGWPRCSYRWTQRGEKAVDGGGVLHDRAHRPDCQPQPQPRSGRVPPRRAIFARLPESVRGRVGRGSLVDGNPQTPGTAAAAFRVPEGSHIVRIEMSAGFDKRNADGDLFTLNHRIKRVRIKRGGAVREHTFDTNVRTPQAIPIDAAGGSYRIEIVETLPGTKSAGREACVSELRVLGTPAPDGTASKSAPTDRHHRDHVRLCRRRRAPRDEVPSLPPSTSALSPCAPFFEARDLVERRHFEAHDAVGLGDRSTELPFLRTAS